MSSRPTIARSTSTRAAQVREFTIGDSDAVYALAQRPTQLGRAVKQAIDIIDEAVSRYGFVIAQVCGACTPADAGRAITDWITSA